MFNYKMTIQYDGTEYAGWQIQENALTVQEVISNSVKQILQQEINLIGAGRTDAGVHALGQVANFMYYKELDMQKFQYSLNSVLPRDISITIIEQVDDIFHSRYSAKKRAYIYLISERKSPFFDRYSYTHFSEMDMEKLNKLSLTFIGEKDFTSFSKNNPDVQNKVCEVFEARWRKQKNLLIFYIEANRFLYGMVRTIVGTLIKTYTQENATDMLKNIFDQKDRSFAADAAPAKGLFLYKVKY
ncbi:MAG: tRNA pseudouridine(38-40) synthase TruA [Ignavibacteriota bacterium]|nr:MAG: tRNA pseudouridine(38-40) synthase TruA [Chlorobiota bacterium]MBE7477252.1 tRNA pseudouridine(38-40) synthase TruA [Ignavibacteriales bacterium]MBL1122638.1 tRNA pseudouridine(38-40) synthase TruA [Ignavibacteriota bacterium]MCC7095071.1 tRNA pseudouridine(38-40) synthase TruA [Ignavibacteriaceae bacterium]MCE7856281.1 tRNA pseudouridine(38-40) synthase TruA [Ignavibacteria bacterium CHB3]MEB2295677.1 tRNA pseudouridine(38-40) synthase TruA [Ignavibacteria bacterium]